MNNYTPLQGLSLQELQKLFYQIRTLTTDWVKFAEQFEIEHPAFSRNSHARRLSIPAAQRYRKSNGPSNYWEMSLGVKPVFAVISALIYQMLQVPPSGQPAMLDIPRHLLTSVGIFAAAHLSPYILNPLSWRDRGAWDGVGCEKLGDTANGFRQDLEAAKSTVIEPYVRQVMNGHTHFGQIPLEHAKKVALKFLNEEDGALYKALDNASKTLHVIFALGTKMWDRPCYRAGISVAFHGVEDMLKKAQEASALHLSSLGGLVMASAPGVTAPSQTKLAQPDSIATAQVEDTKEKPGQLNQSPANAVADKLKKMRGLGGPSTRLPLELAQGCGAAPMRDALVCGNQTSMPPRQKVR